MISDYNKFGDVVTFDTTYKLVHGNRPFGVFLGLNNHRQSTVFGAAFMYDETSDSFMWLFKTFLRVMQNKCPKTIFTDQDAAMAKALVIAMPNTKHLLCTWHILQNAQKNLGNLTYANVGIKSVISNLMYKVDDVEEFEVCWQCMLDNFNVTTNTWLANLLSMKHVWALAYVKNVWTAGIRTTQLSESFNAGLKQYLSRQYKLLDFFRHYENLLHDKRYKEYEAQYDLIQKLPRLRHPCLTLQQVGKVYTAKILDLFQEEFMYAAMNETLKMSTEFPGGVWVYEVGKVDQHVPRRITRTVDDHLICSCAKFERVDVLCRHILKRMKDVMLLNEIPTRYILKRWTINPTEGNTENTTLNDIMTDPRLEIRRRHRIMCCYMNQITSIASCSENGFNEIMAYMHKLKSIAEKSVPTDSHFCTASNSSKKTMTLVLENDEDIQILNYTGNMAKGFAKKDISKGQRRRPVGPMEKATTRKKKGNPLNTRGGIPCFDEQTTTVREIMRESGIAFEPSPTTPMTAIQGPTTSITTQFHCPVSPI